MEHETGPGTGPGTPDAQPPVAPAGPQTGDERVDETLRPLSELADLPVAEHPPVFERVHGQLVEVLGEL